MSDVYQHPCPRCRVSIDQEITDIMEVHLAYIIRERTCGICGLVYWQRELNECEHEPQTDEPGDTACGKCGART